MKRLAGLVVLALTACPPAKVLPPTQAVAASEVEQTLGAAQAAFAKRPDDAQVREALRLFQSAAAGDPSRVEGLTGAVAAAAWLIEHGAKEDRRAIVDAAVTAGEECQRRAPGTPRCDYWQAVAQGLAAREQPLTALGVLPKIIALLRRAGAAEPKLDDGGPARVLALLLVRAPGWPTGPGNPDEALEEATKATTLAPEHPLNELARAEALAATGDTDAAKASYARAAELGRRRGDADGAEWAAQAQAAVAKLAE